MNGRINSDFGSHSTIARFVAVAIDPARLSDEENVCIAWLYFMFERQEQTQAA